MQTAPLTLESISSTVWAVPPLARTADGTIDQAANAAIAGHIEAGGLTALLYGGNAIFYHLTMAEFEQALAVIETAAAEDTLVVPAIGPSYGTMLDQASVLAKSNFPTAMILPSRDIVSSAGIATGVRHAAERMGRPVVLYVKYGDVLETEHIKALVDDGLISAIKYAVVLEDHTTDPELSRLCDAVDPKLVLSGLGDQPAVIHMRDFGVGGFTTGCGCVVPKMSAALLSAIQSGDFDRAEQLREAFLPLEDLRNGWGPISVLHAAVEEAGIAETGPIIPLLSMPSGEQRSQIREAVHAINKTEATL